MLQNNKERIAVDSTQKPFTGSGSDLKLTYLTSSLITADSNNFNSCNVC